MRIQVKADGHHINIPIPTALIFSRPSVWIWTRTVRKALKYSSKYIPDDAAEMADDYLASIPDEAMYAICAEIMRIKRKYGHWDLVEVQSDHGEKVLIRL